VAMKGKDCVAVACDRRFGTGHSTIATNFDKIFQTGAHLFVGLPGLATDTQTVEQKLRFRVNMYELREGRKVTPKVFTSLLSNMLYERRFGPYFVEPVVAGLDPKTGVPFVAGMDLIGCQSIPEDFAVSGTCSDQLFGMCESLWEEDLGPDQLFEVISQALLNAADRDAASGWGATVYIIEKDRITKKSLKARMD